MKNTIKFILMASCLSLLLISCHSKTYNNYMSQIKARETAINKATSLFDLPEYDWNMWYIGTSMYLEGDEKRDIDNAISSLSASYILKVGQLAVGRYRIVSKSRHTYLLDLTNDARIYRDDILLGTGEWSAGASSFDIKFKQDPNNCYDDIKIDIYPKKETQTFEWRGKLEMDEYGYMREDKGKAEKIK